MSSLSFIWLQGSGEPAPSLFWSKEGGPLPDGQTQLQGDQLIFSGVTRDHQGTYVCSGATETGARDRDSVTVTVNCELWAYFKKSSWPQCLSKEKFWVMVGVPVIFDLSPEPDLEKNNFTLLLRCNSQDSSVCHVGRLLLSPTQAVILMRNNFSNKSTSQWVKCSKQWKSKKKLFMVDSHIQTFSSSVLRGYIL